MLDSKNIYDSVECQLQSDDTEEILDKTIGFNPDK